MTDDASLNPGDAFFYRRSLTLWDTAETVGHQRVVEILPAGRFCLVLAVHSRSLQHLLLTPSGRIGWAMPFIKLRVRA